MSPSESPKPLVVMIDDDLDFLQDAASVLAGRGFRVHTSANPARAARIAAALKADVVLLDLDMPVRSGLSVLLEIRSRTRTADTPVILLTGHRSEEMAIAGFRSGLDDCVFKPFSIGDLEARVRGTLRRKRPDPGFLVSGFEASSRLARDMPHNAWALWMEIPRFDAHIRGTGGVAAKHAASVLLSLGARLCDLAPALEGRSVYEPEPGIFVVLLPALPAGRIHASVEKGIRAAHRLSGRMGNRRGGRGAAADKTVLLHDGLCLVEAPPPTPVFLGIDLRHCDPTFEALRAVREIQGAGHALNLGN
ncbi:MAG: response regulator transcription factor [Spirochaetia bacterium]|nr:response regulator transcription factor [Spirochaetia bacterium]